MAVMHPPLWPPCPGPVPLPRILVGFPGVHPDASLAPPDPLPSLMGYRAFDRLLDRALERMQERGGNDRPLEFVQIEFYVEGTDLPFELREAIYAYLNTLPAEDTHVVDCKAIPARAVT